MKVKKVFRNLDLSLHRQERAHKYVRAVNAARLDKFFAKPFIGALNGHCDGVSSMAKSPWRLNCLVSAFLDGDILLWDVAYKRTVRHFPGHRGAVRGLTISSDGEHVVSCGDNCTMRLWEVPTVFSGEATGDEVDIIEVHIQSAQHAHYRQTKTNAAAWNPQEPMNFTANGYRLFTNRLEFVTGSYDRTVRIFPFNGGHSREMYHTKRMQRVFSVNFSGDATYVLSGSDDTNIRVWKSNASEQLGVLVSREKQRRAYLAAVKKRYKHLPEINSIDRHRHMPKPIYMATKLRHVVTEAERKKEIKPETSSQCSFSN